MKVHHLNCCTLRPRGLGSLTPTLRLMPCHCLLVETGDGLVLVDSGVGEADIDNPKRLGPMHYVLNLGKSKEETAVSHVRRLGFAPRDVKHVICTHLDLDHTGGLADFPEASVHVLKKEHEAAMNPKNYVQRERYRRCHFAHGPRWALHEGPARKKWFGMESAGEIQGLGPDIVLVPLPGHTFGHCGVAVKTDRGWLLHCGDAYDVREEISENPKPNIGIYLFQRVAHLDRIGARNTIESLRRLVREHGSEVTVFATHEPSEFEKLSGEKLKEAKTAK
ncbi:MAG: MBL fold metallo-hydrolase [Thermodesulfobacteriota bacterium]